jgi:hypothetical protein
MLILQSAKYYNYKKPLYFSMRVQTLLKDTEWKKLEELSKKKHLSISSLVRSLLCETLDKIKQKEEDSNGNSARN